MSELQDKILRAKIQESSFEELVEDFDQEAIWLDIEQQIAAKKEQKKKNLLLGLWRYAAVLAIGLFLGFYFQNEKQNETLYAQKIIVKKVVKDTATKQDLIVQNDNTPKSEAKDAAYKKVEHKIARQVDEKPPIADVRELIKVAPIVKEEVLPIAKSKKLEVVYFDDLEIANKHIVAHKSKKNKRKFLQINLPDNNESSSQEPPLRNLIYALK